MANGSENISSMVDASPVTKYLLVGEGRSTGTDVMGGSTRGLVGGPQEIYGDKSIGVGPYELSDRPGYGQRKTYSAAPRGFSAGQKGRRV